MNLRVKEKVDLQTIPEVAAVLAAVESRLEGIGRLLVRYSGTEPLLRVMLEGQDQHEIRKWGQEIIDAVKQHIGAAERSCSVASVLPEAGSREPGAPRLSVNVNKVAPLRNSRGGSVPSVLPAVDVCIGAGAPGITVHPRAHERHIRADDVRQIAGHL